MLIHKIENRLDEEEYADKYIKQLEQTIETIDNDIMKIFKKANKKGQWSNAEMAKYNRKEKLRKQIRNQIKKYKKGFISDYRDDLAAMYKKEALFTQDLLKDVPTLEISDQFDTLPTQAIKSEVVDSVQIKGKTMTEYISKYSTDLAFRIEQEAFESIAFGENPNKTSRRLYGISDQMGKNRVDATTRSWMNAIFNQANLDVYQQGGIEKVRYLATLDAVTCPVCSADHNKVMTIDEVIHLPRHPNCYSEDTEVYTDEGWKFFKDLCGDEKILSMNPDNLEIDFLDYDKEINYYYEGEMYHITNKSLDMLVTPNHNQIIGTRSDPYNRSYKSYKIEEIQDIFNRSEFYIPRTGNWKGKDLSYIKIGGKNISIETYCKFMGYYLSEGSVTRRGKNWYQISIHQTQPNKDKMFKDIKDMPFKVKNRTKDKIYINDVDLGKYLIKLGKSAEKYIPKEIKQLPPEKLEIFINAFALGDGSIKSGTEWKEKDLKSKDEMVLMTSSKMLADDLGEVIVKAGYYPSYSIDEVAGNSQKFKNGTYIINNDIYRIRRNRSKHAAYRKNQNWGIKFNKINYSGKVYDVELPKWHVLWTRRNGKTVWSGNCRCAYSPYISTELTGPATGYDEWLLDGRRSPEQLQAVLNRTKRFMRTGRIKKKEGQRLLGIIGAAMKNAG